MTKYPEETTEDSFRDFGHGVSLVKQNMEGRMGEAELLPHGSQWAKSRETGQEQAISSKPSSP